MVPPDKAKELRLLFSQWLNGEADEKIIRQLVDHAEDKDMEAIWHSLLAGIPFQELSATSVSEHKPVLDQVYLNLVTAQPELQLPTPVSRIRRITGWMKYAAALILVLAVWLFYFFLKEYKRPAGTETVTTLAADSLIRGNSNKAVLTLGNGQQILLDSSGKGQLAQQNGALIFKSEEGKIVYRKEDSLLASAHHTEYNSVSTPRGAEYKIVLPDGTAVWLNAASSITFPTAFTGAGRSVSIQGEAYFEVAKNRSMPFKVNFNGATVEVLGTNFNINTYKDEPLVSTTLLEGSIRFVTAKESRILKPGQQIVFNKIRNTVSMSEDIDEEQVIAWKNGTFDFRDQDIETVMNQVGRWYNMDIFYNGPKPEAKILGMMSRDTDLNTLLKSLALTSGIRFKIERPSGKDPGKIIVQP